MSRIIKFRAFSDRSGMWDWSRLTERHPLSCLYSHEGWQVMQFTGLLDKNGVEIFEGDILEITDSSGFAKRKSVVHSIDHEQNYRSDRNLPGREAFLSAWGMQDAQGGFEAFIHINRPCDYAAVIGNIHENPELLKTAEGGEE